MTQNIVEPKIHAAVELIAARLGVDSELPWLVGGAAAQVLQGVAGVDTDELLLLTGAAEVARVAALLGADEVEPLAMRPAPGYGPSPRGRYALPLASNVSLALELVGDLMVLGKQGQLSLALERIWPLRVPWQTNAGPVALVPLEIELASELLRGHATEADAIASYLLERGAQWDRLDLVLAQVPALEEPLWELMDVVRPLANRARGRRIRRQIGWGGRRR